MPRDTFWKKRVKQESFNTHFPEANHNGEDDWQARLIDQTDNVEKLDKRESPWQLELDTFQPNGLIFMFNIQTSAPFLVILIYKI